MCMSIGAAIYVKYKVNDVSAFSGIISSEQAVNSTPKPFQVEINVQIYLILIFSVFRF